MFETWSKSIHPSEDWASCKRAETRTWCGKLTERGDSGKKNENVEKEKPVKVGLMSLFALWATKAQSLESPPGNNLEGHSDLSPQRTGMLGLDPYQLFHLLVEGTHGENDSHI